MVVFIKPRHVFLVVLLGNLALTLGCSSQKKPKPDQDVYSATTSDRAPNATSRDLPSSDLGHAFGLQTIHFGYDSILLDSSSTRLLHANADLLKNNSVIRVQVEDHCDSRGSIQYNIALGEKRAVAVKHYLEDLGVRLDRITTISYGKERPLDPAQTEEAYAKDRRANFVVTQGVM